MLTVFLDKNEAMPMYAQLYRSIRERIEAGELRENEKLPSVRTFAKELGLAAITVANAYGQLVAEGYVRTVPKSGFFVEPGILPLPSPRDFPLPPEKDDDPCLYDFRTNVVDPGRFPFAVWSRLERDGWERGNPDWINQVDPQGNYELRAQIAATLSRHRGVHADPSQIVVGSGTEALLGLIVRLLDPVGTFGLENPGYAKVVRTLRGLRVPCVPLRLDESGLRPEEAENAGVSVVHLTPSHQFPSGIVMPVGRRMEWIRWTREKASRWLIEDDYDSEFRFSGMPIPAMQGMDPAGRILYLNSFSKSLAPSLRVGYLVLPAELAARFRDSSPAFACSVPGLVQSALCAFLREGEFDRHLNRMKKAYREKRDRLIAGLKQSRFGSRCQILHAEAGLHFLMRIDNSMEERVLVERAKAAGVRVHGLSEYVWDPSAGSTPPTLVVGYSGMSVTECVEALERLERVWG